MKKQLTIIALAVTMIFSLLLGMAAVPVQAEVEKLDWTGYDELIGQIKSATDFVEREALMHQAEDILMDSGAIVPLYYYNDVYMAKPDLTGYYSNLYGFKYFMFSGNGDSDKIRLCLASEPDKLDPALNSSVDGACLAVNSFSGLFAYNAEGQVVPDLVDTYEMSEDGLVYTFTLKDDLKWSDGDPLNAKDFEYSWKRAVNWMTAADYAYMFDCIDGYPEIEDPEAEITEESANAAADGLNVVASEDGKTLTVTLKAPTPYFLDLCAFPTYYPVKQAAVEGADGYRDAEGKIKNPGAWAREAGFVSNGAYVLTSWDHNSSMTYEKNPYYHRADEVKIEKLEFMLSDDQAVIYSAYNSDDLDFIDSVPTDEIKGLMESNNPEFYIVDNLGTYFVIFNVKSPLFDGKTVEQAKNMRKAVTLLIDRQFIVDTITQTGQKIANTFIPEGMADGHGGVFKENDEDYTYPVEDEVGYFTLEPDVEGAIELLKAAGYEFEGEMLSQDTPLKIRYLLNKSEAHEKVAESIQQDLAVIGIEMEIDVMDWATVLNERKAGNYDVARHGWIADFNDPINMLEMWSTDSGNNDAQFGR